MQNTWKYKLLAAVSLAALLLTAWSLKQRRDDQQDQQGAAFQAYADEKGGVTTQAVSLKLHQLTLRAQREGVLPDGDVDWVIGLLTTRDTRQPELLHYDALDTLRGIPRVSPAQADSIHNAVVPLLSSRLPLDRNGAVEVLGALKDKKAIPKILPLLHDPDPNIREHTREALKSIED